MFESYPVVTGLDGMAFVGTVSRKDLVSGTGRDESTQGGTPREGDAEGAGRFSSKPALPLDAIERLRGTQLFASMKKQETQETRAAHVFTTDTCCRLHHRYLIRLTTKRPVS